jgi:hypothetical protein
MTGVEFELDLLELNGSGLIDLDDFEFVKFAQRNWPTAWNTLESLVREEFRELSTSMKASMEYR